MLLKLFLPKVRKSCFSTMAQTINQIQEASLAENCILVNEKDKAIGHATKKDCHHVASTGLLLHRAFSVFLFNTKNEMLIQRRSDTKVTFPGHITNTCCSHPLHDIMEERIVPGALGVKLAAIRRMDHELGIAQKLLAPEDLHYVTRVLYRSEGDGIWGEYEIDYMLLVKKDLPIKPNPEEVSDVYYVSREKFDDFIQQSPDRLTPWFKLVTDNRLRLWWDNIDNIDQFKDHHNIHRFDE